MYVPRLYPTLLEASRAAAELTCQKAAEAVEKRGIFSIALSGGSSPRPFYELLAQEPFRSRMPWAHVDVFWGDDRYVPPDDGRSNYALANSLLLSNVPIPSQNIHRIPTEKPFPQAAARYEQELRRFFGIPETSQDIPSIDMQVMGVGPDGHTASLFPQDPALQEKKRWVVAVEKAKDPPFVPRVTMTLPIINASRCAFFLASAHKKGNILKQVLSGSSRLPAAMVHPKEQLIWFIEGKI